MTKEFKIPLIKIEEKKPSQKQEPERINKPPEKKEVETGAEDELNEAFKVFNEKTSKLKPDFSSASATPQNSDSPSVSPDPVMTDFAFEIKMKMFLGALCYVLSGLHVVLFNLLTKKQITFEDMQLNETEQASIRIYLNSPKVLELINKIPGWVWGIIHVEFIFLGKLKKVTALKSVGKKKSGNE